MGFVGGLIGTAGGQQGTGMGGVKGGTVINPVGTGQTAKSYKDVQKSMEEQRNLLGALQGQNGLANQSQVYGQYQGMVNGTGPNPALAQLHNATAQNSANQAAMMAAQRGSGQNAGLLARQAAMQGAANQQNSIGQAAALQAQQSQNALNSAAGIANNQVSNQIGQTNANTNAQQSEQANLFNAINGVNSNLTANQGSVNSVNGQLTNTAMQGQQGLLGGLMSSAGSMMGMGGARGGKVPNYDEGGEVSADPTKDDVQQPEPQASAPVEAPAPNFGNFSSQVQPGSAPSVSTPSFGADAGADALAKGFGKAGGSSGGGGGGMSSMLPMLMALAEGGEVSGAYDGPVSKFGQFLSNVQSGGAPGVSTPSFGANNAGATALQKGFGKFGGGLNSGGGSKSSDMAGGAGDSGGMPGMMGMMAASGGKVPALVSPGEKYLSPDKVSAVKQGANPMAVGETIPGKPKVEGANNSYANDTVPAQLDSGGIVLPRSVTQSKDAGSKAKAFVEAVMAKKSLPKKK